MGIKQFLYLLWDYWYVVLGAIIVFLMLVMFAVTLERSI